jgi:multiple sugar transport system substrate-binding protein
MNKNGLKNALFFIMLVLCGGLVAAGAQGDRQKENYDLTVLSVDTTSPKFVEWKADVEAATGLKINFVAAPTDADTRQQKVTTILSSGDTSVDILEVNDEMLSAFKNTGWLEPMQGKVLTPEILTQLPQVFVQDMMTAKNGDIVGIQKYNGYLALWVNQEILNEVGIPEIKNKDDWIEFCKRASAKPGRYGYGGSWEKTYVFNEIGTFVNLFGGDYFDWTNPRNREAMQFMYDMVNTWKVTPIDQIADRYEQMNQKFIDGKYGMLFMWGGGGDYDAAGMRGPDKIHIAQIPQFNTRSVFADSWYYVLNKASKHKDAAIKFMQYRQSQQGMMANFNAFEQWPARKDVASLIPNDNFLKAMYRVYADTTVIRGRPMLPQSMEFITDMGTVFQAYVQNKIGLDDFCRQAQGFVNKYRQ